MSRVSSDSTEKKGNTERIKRDEGPLIAAYSENGALVFAPILTWPEFKASFLRVVYVLKWSVKRDMDGCHVACRFTSSHASPRAIKVHSHVTCRL